MNLLYKPASVAQMIVQRAVPTLAPHVVARRPRWWMHTTLRIPAGNSNPPTRLVVVKMSYCRPIFKRT